MVRSICCFFFARHSVGLVSHLIYFVPIAGHLDQLKLPAIWTYSLGGTFSQRIRWPIGKQWCCTHCILSHAHFSMGNFICFFLFSPLLTILGERPYKCHLPECGRAFIQLSNLQQHLRNHDAQVERAKNRPFHCNICGKGFATESSLRTHTSKVSHVCIECV